MHIDWDSHPVVKKVAGKKYCNLPTFADIVLFGLAQVAHERLTQSNLFPPPFRDENVIITGDGQYQLIVIGAAVSDFLSVSKLGVRAKIRISDDETAKVPQGVVDSEGLA
jgi:hypothetical protein